MRSLAWERYKPLALPLCAFGLVLVVWWPFLSTSQVNNIGMDWTIRSNYASYTVHALFDRGEVPYFTTQTAYQQMRRQEANVFFANPETNVLSPLIWLYRVVPLIDALKLHLCVYLLVGVFGAYLAMRRAFGEVSTTGYLASCLIFFGGGAFSAHLLVGHVHFLPVPLFPMIMALALGAVQAGSTAAHRLGQSILAGALLALSYYEGGTHFLIFLLMFLGLMFASMVAARPGRWRSVLLGGAATLLAFVVLAAYKLLPGLQDFGGYDAPYLMTFASPSELVARLLSPAMAVHYTVTHLNHEFYSYTGEVGTGVLAIGLLGWSRRGMVFLVPGLVLLAFSMDPVAGWLQRDLPVFSTQGVFTRFRVVAVLGLVMASALVLQRIALKFRSRPRWIVVGVIAAAAIIATLTLDLRRHNFRDKVAAFSTGASPTLHPVDFEPPRFFDPHAQVSVEVVDHGVNWAQYRYSVTDAEFGDSLLVGPRLNAKGTHLRITGDVERVSGDVVTLRPTQEEGRFAVRFHQPVLELGRWITLIGAGVFILAGGLVMIASRRRRSKGERGDHGGR